MKVINDAIHGQFNLDGVRASLLETPEMNKLSHIKQLGLAHLGFPGAHHTRFEHSLGVSHIGGMMADSIGLDEHEKTLVEVAGMLMCVFVSSLLSCFQMISRAYILFNKYIIISIIYYYIKPSI